MDLAGQMTIFISSHDLNEIDSFATDVAFIDQGRLLFQDSMDTLMGRFREVQITLQGEAVIPKIIPSEWMNVKVLGSVVSFVDTRFAESTMSGRLSPYWSQIQRVETKPLTLRAIFTTLARANRAEHRYNREVPQ